MTLIIVYEKLRTMKHLDKYIITILNIIHMFTFIY